MTKQQINSAIKGNLVVSCQALPDEPLHSSFIMGRMAKAVIEGGACGIRANSVADILEIKKHTDLPIIGIIKKEYEGCHVYITPTIRELDDLVKVGADIIAVQATEELRPDGQTLEEFYREVREKYPDVLLMADCSTLEEAVKCDRLGFDYIGTTMVGYTQHSKHLKISENDFALMKEILSNVKQPVIAEGNISTPEQARRVLELGCFCVVVGSSITRPQLITKKFYDEIKSLEEK